MKRKMMMLALALMVSAASFAQFEQNKVYVGASLSGLDISYNSTQKWKGDAGVKLGWLFAKDWMLTGQADYSYRKGEDRLYDMGLGLRYYIEQNGLYLGLGANYVHGKNNYDDLMPTVQLGYAFFLSRTVTIEPEVFYNQSLESHSRYSGVGLRLGFGIYL